MSTDERKEILDLLAQGKITVDEAATLLAQAKMPQVEPEIEVTQPKLDVEVEAGEQTEKPAPVPDFSGPVAATGRKPSWFRVRVNNLETGKSKVSVNIPVRMLKFGFTIASHFTPQMDFDMAELESMLMDGESGLLVDVRDEESREHVQIYLD